MKLLLLCATLAFLSSCSTERTPSETLVAYYDAVDKADTTAILALSEHFRRVSLRQHMPEYVAYFSGKQTKIQILGERIKNENVAIVTFLEKGDSVECVMVRENEEWLVGYCRKPEPET